MKLVVFWLCIGAAARLSAADFDIKAYGATGDGHTIDSPAIDRAIGAAAAAGGGTVVVPAGTYACFSVHLQSHITLKLESGSTILAAEPPADLSTGYDAPEPNPVTDRFEDFGHSHWHNSLIWGENLVDVSIVGPGRIYGRGLSKGNGRGGRRDDLPEEMKSGRLADVSLPEAARREIAAQPRQRFGYPGNDTLPAGVGNKAIALKNCRNVIFRDFTIEHGGHFAILCTGVDNWTVDGLKIDTNRDGIDLDCCQNVRVANCTVNSPYDDGICPKSSFGLGYSRITENVTITNCQVSGYDEGTLLDGTRQRQAWGLPKDGPTGRIKYGTESNGGFRNVTISNCVFEFCRGLALESVDGGVMEDITVSNLSMRDIVNTPIFIRLGRRNRGPHAQTGVARRIKISNVIAYNVTAQAGILIDGLPGHPVEDVWLNNIFIAYAGGGTAEEARRVVPGMEEAYPEPDRWGTLPAWGLWVRHIRGLTMDDVTFRALKPEARPMVKFEDARGVVTYNSPGLKSSE